MLFSMAPTVTGSLLAVGDAASTRTVYAIVVTLLLIGVALVGLAIWLIRQTRVDPELLAPLERMADRDWRKLDPVGRRRMLDDVRPEGAEPVHRMPEEPEVDREFGRAPPVPSFDDLEAVIVAAGGTVPGAEPPKRPDAAEVGAAGESGPDVESLGDGGSADEREHDTVSLDADRPAGATAVAAEVTDAADGDAEVFAGDRGGEPAATDDDR